MAEKESLIEGNRKKSGRETKWQKRKVAEKESGREGETNPVAPRDWSGEYRLSGLKGRRLTIARLGPGTVGRWVGRT